MKALPTSDRRNWTRQAEIHNNFCPHGNWLFLPWHRVYLFYFEEICRELSGMKEFALPYWNWSKSPSIPAAFWGAGNPLLNGTRTATSSSVASATMVGASVIQSILAEPNFLNFASDSITLGQSQRTVAGYDPLEAQPHNYVHGFVGGQMASYMSPLDPVFWCHHNMIECCWVEWNLARGNPNTNDSNWVNREFTEFVDRHGNPVTVKVATTLLYPILSHRYDDAGLAAVAVAGAQSESDAQMRRHLERGAAVEVETIRRFPVRKPLKAVLGEPLAVPLDVTRGVLKTATAEGQRTHLELEGVSMAHTGDFFVRVFIDKPDATADTPIEDPHYAGAIAFFGHVHGDAAPKGRFSIEASRALRRVEDDGRLDVTLVPVPYGDAPKSRQVELGGVQLAVTRDKIKR